MNKLRSVILCGMLLACSYGYGEMKFLREVQDSIVTKNTEFVQATMEHKCHKLQKKIKKLHDKLAALEYSDEDMEWVADKKEKILKDIQKYEELLEGLQRLNQTIDNTLEEVFPK